MKDTENRQAGKIFGGKLADDGISVVVFFFAIYAEVRYRWIVSLYWMESEERYS